MYMSTWLPAWVLYSRLLSKNGFLRAGGDGERMEEAVFCTGSSGMALFFLFRFWGVEAI